MLSVYRITKNATLFLVMRLVGGASRPMEPLSRKIDKSVPRSKEDCMILLTDGDNVLMPCKHTISPEALIDHSWNEICVNKKTKVQCCLCSQEWVMSTIQRYGGATEQEVAIMQECMSLNFCHKDPKMSECPSCHNFCERMQESSRCLQCRICSNAKSKPYHFCWDCKQEWIGSVYNAVCGNDTCINNEILTKLRNCPETTIGYLNGLKVPFTSCMPILWVSY